MIYWKSLLVMVLLVVKGSWSAPRSKSKASPTQTVFDQKQTGDYNIQLHLKDFQIIALLADDSLGGFGDYDYSYDYSDFTVKPIGGSSSTTSKPLESSSTSETTPIQPETIKPQNHPYPIILPSSKPTEKPILNSTTPTVHNEVVPQTSQRAEEVNSPGKIKVQILETPVSSPSLGIVPGEEIGQENESLPVGDILQYRRCLSGFARDKKGRCRRVRRPSSPQLPFGISRLATNLASRFRYANTDAALTPSDSATSQELEE